jgi:SAM-dependent methyltransferase
MGVKRQLRWLLQPRQRLQQARLAALRAQIPTSSSLTEKWDQEWLNYFLTEDPRPFFFGHHLLKGSGDVRHQMPIEVYHTSLFEIEGFGALPPLCIWAPGEALMAKHILELGCGPGLLGKQLGHIAASYLGIDYSRFALQIARLTSPDNCTYLHLSELDAMMDHADTVDTMIGRFFFIHQNYQNIMWNLQLAEVLLNPGGRIFADFYMANTYIPQGIVYTAHAEIDAHYPSCAFAYTVPELEQAAAERGFAVESIMDQIDLQRRFAVFVKKAAS